MSDSNRWLQRAAPTCAVLAFLCIQARGQSTATNWISPAGGLYANDANWSMGAPLTFARNGIVPSTTPALTISVDQSVNPFAFSQLSPVVTLSMSPNISFLAPNTFDNAGTILLPATTGPDLTTFTNLNNMAGGAVNIESGRNLVISAPSFGNAGTITVNSDGGSGPAALALNARSGQFFAINGDRGSILLNAGTDPSTAQLNGDANHPIYIFGRNEQIHGTGQINVPIYDNYGEIVGDVPGRSLVIRGGVQANDGTIGSIAGGILDFDGTSIPGGMTVMGGSTAANFYARNGKIRFLGGVTFNSYRLTSESELGMPGSIENAAGSNTVSTRLTAGTVFNQLNGTTLHLGYFIMEPNTILTVNSDNGATPTPLIVDSGQALSGSGQLVINDEGTAGFLKNLTPITHTLQSLIINGSGQADLTNNALQINYGAAPTPAATIQSYIASGYHGGSWNGPGLITSLGDASHGLGYADGADGVVPGLAPGSMLVKFARYGDANLDNNVDFADLLIVEQYYGKMNTRWDEGDFNNDGSTGQDDLLLLTKGYNGAPTPAQFAQLNPDFRMSAESAFANVPEPDCPMMLILCSGGLLFRLRGRRITADGLNSAMISR